MNTVDYKTIKKIEGETLRTFREEIPSIYFSDKTEKEYLEYRSNAEAIYRDLFKFPPKMFEGAKLIDFGAGTGENTVYLSNWGATCTLVEMNDLSQNISKDVFKKYATNPDRHRFFLSSIFDFESDERGSFDIVHCRGVLSHTAAKAAAFRKIVTFVKPGGYLIFGDPNRAGGFQNMLQRYAVYHFAKTPDEMVDVSEVLFKEDIDRSQRHIPRTRRSIIFDRWVIQRQDDPSLAEVAQWVKDCGLRLYSAYPGVLLPLFGDSLHHQPRFDPYSATELLAIPELVWMMQTDSDEVNIRALARKSAGFSWSFAELTSYVAAFSLRSELDTKRFGQLSRDLQSSFEGLELLDPVKAKLAEFLAEANEFVKLVPVSDLQRVRDFVVSTKHLFKGACGNRHIDVIAYKPV